MKKSLKKEFAFILTVTLVITGVFLFVHPSLAFADWAARVLSGLIGAFISGLGVVVGLVIEVLIRVAQYNDFTGSQAIEKGWIIVRDLANMFFILVFLIIAFATILRIESYNYKKHLPKLLLMAVFINFSKTIAGLIIDVGQVAMITFVNGFKDIGAGNLTHMLGLTEILQMKEGADVGDWTIFTAYLLAFFYILIALVTIVAILAVLVMRMVMLWIYVVLSPLAFLLAAFPGGKKYSEMWWSNFSKEVIVGPVLAFFIWLSFATVSITTGGNDIVPMGDITDDMTKEQIAEIQASNEQISQAATTDVFIKFIISIGMLVGGLVVSKQIGATAGKAAGTALNTINKGKDKVLGAGRSAIRGGLRRGGKQLKTWGGDAVDHASSAVGMDLNVARGHKRYKAQLQQRRQERQAGVYKQTLDTASQGGVKGSMAMMLTGDKAWDHFKNRKLGKGMRSQKKLYQGAENLKQNNEEMAQTKEERGKYMSNADVKNIENEKGKLSARNDEIDQEIIKKNYNLKSATGDDKTKIEKEIESLEKEKAGNNSKKSSLDGKLKNITHDDKKASELDNKLAKLEKEKKQISNNLKSVKAKHGSGFGLTDARVSAGAELEGEAAKKIANVSNDGDLVEIIKEAIDRKDHAMIQAAYKKLAKTGNFNELNKAFGIGTDHESMKKIGQKFQSEAEMPEQESLALLGEVGDITKGLGQFSGFGHTTMENGRWRETSQEERDAAAFTESSKMQLQKWARDVTHLGIGSYKGEDGHPHDDEHFELNRDTIALLASKDEQYAKQLGDTGNTNLINKLSTNNNIQVLAQNGATQVAEKLQEIKDKRTGAVKNNEDINEMLKEINLKVSK
ncbi:hypothetical protein K9M50_03050 [Patescibacteria group bacterium]|nr:hypothetical protein [Patescibacteria group bacterium]